MIRLFCTKRLAEKLPEKPADFQGKLEPLDKWCLNILTVGDVNVVVAMCPENRFGFFLWDIEEEKLSDLPELVSEELDTVLEFYGVQKDIREKYLCDEPQLCYGVDPKEEVWLNRMCTHVSLLTAGEDIVEAVPMEFVSKINETVTDSAKKDVLPKNRMLEELKERYQGSAPLQKAYEIEATMDLENHVAKRIIRISQEATFGDFHRTLQAAFGWDDYHLYEFILKNLTVTNCDHYYGYYEGELVSGENIRLCEVLRPYLWFEYHYDFGDNWEVELSVTRDDVSIASSYPICTFAEGIAPPEDVGGVPGFLDFLEAYEDPDHPDHEDLVEWVIGRWKSTEPDLEDLNAQIAKYIYYKI